MWVRSWGLNKQGKWVESPGMAGGDEDRVVCTGFIGVPPDYAHGRNGCHESPMSES
jgi:hypothetical protein